MVSTSGSDLVRRAEEDTLLGPLGEKAQPGPIPEHDLDEVGLAAAEYEQVTREGVLPQDTLDQHGKPVQPRIESPPGEMRTEVW